MRVSVRMRHAMPCQACVANWSERGRPQDLGQLWYSAEGGTPFRRPPATCPIRSRRLATSFGRAERLDGLDEVVATSRIVDGKPCLELWANTMTQPKSGQYLGP